jgi:hypothetical protein
LFVSIKTVTDLFDIWVKFWTWSALKTIFLVSHQVRPVVMGSCSTH